ncbi:CDP-diglyceride synthetase [Ralstonia sp. 1138]
MFIAATLASAAELLARLQVSQATRIALLTANAVLVAAAGRGLMATEPATLLLLAVNAILLSGGLASDDNDKFNTALLIGASSLAILGRAAIEATRLLTNSSAHMPVLQECIVLMAAQDFCASAGGKLWPRGRLAPRISPHKTLSGAAFGLAGGISSWFLLQVEVGSNFSAMGALAVLIAGILGDLLFSSVKRALMVKDFSDTLGVKGGILDRIDSTVVAVLAAHALAL